MSKDRTPGPEGPDTPSRDHSDSRVGNGDETIRALLNAAPERALLLDTEGNILGLNQPAAQSFGKPIETLIGLNAFDLFAPHVASRRRAYHEQVVQKGEPVRYEDQRENRWLDTRLYPVKNPSGVVEQVAIYSRDVTEYREKEEELRRFRHQLAELVTEKTAELIRTNQLLRQEISERTKAEESLLLEKIRLESLIRYSALAIVTLDETHNIIQCNQAFEELFLVKESGIIGKNLDQVVTNPETLDEARTHTEKTLKGEPIHGMGKRFRSDGCSVDVEFFGVPVIVEGKVTGAYGIYMDQSELRQAEKALRKSEIEHRRLYEESKKAEELYRSLITSSPDPIVIYDMEGRTRYVSTAFTEVFGWTLEELEGRKAPFLPESEKDRSLTIIKDVVEKGIPCQGFETKRYTKDGRILDVSIAASRYDNHLGEPSGMLVMLRDISERKALEAQLLQAHKMEAIGTLAGGIAHDFNNILQAITGYTQLLMLKREEKDTESQMLKAIEHSADRASDLTQRLLVFGRKVESKLRPVDLNNEIRQVVKLLERTIPRMIKIELRLSDDLNIINADPVQLEQIAMNLAVNARDAMPEGGRLIFETHNVFLDDEFCRAHLGAREGASVLFRISDNGHGMSEDIRSHIFEPFFTTKETGKGTGLGLAMVYGIVKSHGGYIHCSSAPDTGTTFEIYFPTLKMEGQEKEPGSESKIVKGGNEMILLVDDEETILEIGSAMLARHGYRTLLAESGEQAIDIVQSGQETIDMVVLDINMPGMGGQKCLEKLLEIAPTIKVIISTGYLSDGLTKKTMETGAVNFIAKPYRLEELLDKVREVLDQD